MAELQDLAELQGEEPTAEQILGILNQIDLDIANLARDGKLAALKYGVPGSPGASTDRAANLRALLEARKHYEGVLRDVEARQAAQQPPAWIMTTAQPERDRPR